MGSPHELRRSRARKILGQLEAEVYRRTDVAFPALAAPRSATALGTAF